MRWPGFRRSEADEHGALEHASDARRVDVLRGRLRDDPEAERRLKLRRRLIGSILVATLVASGLAAVFGEGGYRDLRRKERLLVSAGASLDEARARVARLREAVRRLEHDPAARERIAREDLGLVLPGEVDFLLPRTADADPESPRRDP